MKKSRLYSPLKRTSLFFFAAVIYRISLDIGYIKFVSPMFSYAGFELDIDYGKYIESWFISLLLVLTAPKIFKKSSDFLAVYMLFIIVIPTLSFYGLANESRQNLYILLLGFCIIQIFRIGRPFKVPLFGHGRAISLLFATFGTLASVVWLFVSGAGDLFNLNFMLVYEFRDDADLMTNKGIMGYLVTWSSKVFGPFLLTIFLWEKAYARAAAIFVLHIFLFGLTSHKSVLFYPLLVIFIWYFFQGSKSLMGIPLGLAVATFLPFLVYILFSDIIFGSLIIRRVFYVPAYLSFAYLEFFSQNAFVYWSNSITSSFFEYPYHMNTSLLIGEYTGSGASANNTFISTGYMHAGIPGTIFYGVLVGFLFRLIDSISYRGVPPWVALGAIFVPMHALITSADLPTAILTHGIGISLVLLCLSRSAKNTSDFSPELPRMGVTKFSHQEPERK